MKNKIMLFILFFLAYFVASGQFTLSTMAWYTRTNKLHQAGLNGEGMTIYIYEPGKPLLTHEQFENRAGAIGYENVFVSDGDRDHATHIGGIILSGGVNTKPKGMAYKATGIFRPADDDEIDAFAELPNFLISNHSYVDNVQAIILDDLFYGLYNEASRSFDEAMCKKPFWLPVVAAGNTGQNINKTPMQQNYDLLPTGLPVSKNSLTVANASDVIVDPFEGIFGSAQLHPTSAVGPTDDYRIKPDITGFGTNIESSGGASPTYYYTATGTSQACSNVSGTLLLLQQQYKQLWDNYMLAATVKGLTLHTADLMSDRPNSKSGWGLLNAGFAGATIAGRGTSSIIEERTLRQGETFAITVQAAGHDPLQASICWTDPPGKVPDQPLNSAVPTLVNDLDLRVYLDGSLNPFKPYALTSASTTVLDDNKRDPFERVDIAHPIKNRMYKIVVTNKNSLLNGHQDFTLIVTGIGNAATCLNTIEITKPVLESDTYTAKNITNSTEITGSAINIEMQVGEQAFFVDGTNIHNVGNVHVLASGCSGDVLPTSSQQRISGDMLNNADEATFNGTAEKTDSSGLQLYPNPVQHWLALKSNMSITQVKIFNMSGMLVKAEAHEGVGPMQVNVGMLAGGMYMVAITRLDGTVIIKKFIKN